MNVLLLAAGKGQRFQDKGYPPKPLIDVDGQPMWQLVLENLLDRLPTHWENSVVVATKPEYGITSDKYQIVNLHGPQYGALWSALSTLQEADISLDEPLLILNVDQLIYFLPSDLDKWVQFYHWDGILFHFNEPNGENKWGRSIIPEDKNRVIEIVEKTPVSPHAHTGHYMFKSTAEFMKYAHQIINRDIKINGEYFLSPVYNLMLEDGKKIFPFFVNRFVPLGIPDDLESYLQNKE